jgi:hypothetical protein
MFLFGLGTGSSSGTCSRHIHFRSLSPRKPFLSERSWTIEGIDVRAFAVPVWDYPAFHLIATFPGFVTVALQE